MIISQTKHFNIFPGLIQILSISKILTVNCKQYTIDYIPVSDLWLNRLYFEIWNSNKKSCVTIDCHNFNSLGLSKFRTDAESGTEQICYYKSFNRFLELRKDTADDSIIFEINNIVEENKTGSFDYYNISSELGEFNNGRFNNNRSNLKRPISEFSSTDFSRGGKFIGKKPIFLSR